nr:immunoglobulin heavy chain junction region [Macaca mulatta]MOW88229.1 immunoglobulin heavy chain junction region [Macaca mulatta]MOW89273.1 immunoglobulin heavy chain junction region [Macaca mulatta]MOW90858.1 immunoglobulin heavy chain junction region [Macaca mulatta]MOW91354.1 immunoglobulin heavy chain junction region [Macaca mulatta]
CTFGTNYGLDSW